jgi:uncharacterized phage infection (PIP) family protein YhgE
MSEIVGSVQRVSDIIGEITAASGEQSDGIGQVNVAVTQLDQMTQQNAALVEESAAAAESLREQAGKLAQVVQIFRIDGAQAHVTPVVMAARPAIGKPARTQPVGLKPAAPKALALTSSVDALKRPTAAAPAVRPAQAAQAAQAARPAAGAGAEGDWESF